MNAAVKTYLAELQDDAKLNTGYGYALQKCSRIVGRSRSPLDPGKVDLIKGFGEGQVSRRMKGHFAKPEFQEQLAPREVSELHSQVHQELDRVLSLGQLGDKSLSRAVRRRVEETKTNLEVFLVLQDIRDVGLLKSCMDEVANHLQSIFTPQRKRKAAGGPEKVRAKRRKPDASVASVAPPQEHEAEAPASVPNNSQLARACKPLSGGWAIMVGLHINGSPQTKRDLVALSAEQGLCREPLVKPQRTVSRLGQWYDAWSSISRLQKAGWVLRTGVGQYSLTDAGLQEAALYVKQREEAKGQRVTPAKGREAISPSASNVATPVKIGFKKQSSAAAATPVKTGASAVALTSLKKEVVLPVAVSSCSFVSLRSAPSRCNAIDLSDSDDNDNGDDAPALESSRSSSSCLAAHIRDSPIADDCLPVHARFSPGGIFRVLVDLTEKQTVRECISKALPSSVQLQLPGVDYACGTKHGEDWILGKVLVERKTVHDFLATKSSERGERQACVQKSLRDVGFHVVIILEGINDLRQHPQHKEVLAEAHASATHVLTTASMHDTTLMLEALAANAQAHDGWTLNSMRVLVQHHYDIAPEYVCKAVLLTLGVAEPFAQAVARSYGSVHALLQDILRSMKDKEASVESVAQGIATRVGITSYQANKLLLMLGVGNASLSRKGGSQRNLALTRTQQKQRRWKVGVLKSQKVYVEVGFEFPKELLRGLQASVQVEVINGLAADHVRVCNGQECYLFRIGNGRSLEPGAHWLISATEIEWEEVTRLRAAVYVHFGTVSTLCASKAQAVQHIVARVDAMAQQCSRQEGASARSASKLGLEGVLRWTRTAGGALPTTVVKNLASRVQHLGGLVPLARKICGEGTDFPLGAQVGAERADAVRALLLGGA